MKKRYQPKKRAPSYKVRPSKYYNAYALVVNGKEIAWGDEQTMKSRRETFVRSQK